MYKHFREYEKLVIKTVAEPPECCRGCCLVIVEVSASSPQHSATDRGASAVRRLWQKCLQIRDAFIVKRAGM